MGEEPELLNDPTECLGPLCEVNCKGPNNISYVSLSVSLPAYRVTAPHGPPYHHNLEGTGEDRKWEGHRSL